MIELPKHVNLHIEHQPHAANYETVQQWLEWAAESDYVDVAPADAEEMLRTGEVWVVQWYPNTPVGFCTTAAATLQRALELALESE